MPKAIGKLGLPQPLPQLLSSFSLDLCTFTPCLLPFWDCNILSPRLSIGEGTPWDLKASQILQESRFPRGLNPIMLNLTSGLPLSAAPRGFRHTRCILVFLILGSQKQVLLADPLLRWAQVPPVVPVLPCDLKWPPGALCGKDCCCCLSSF